MASTINHGTPFKVVWLGPELGPSRPSKYMYELYPYELLPPIPELHGTLDWLSPVDAHGQDASESARQLAVQARDSLARIEAEAAQLGLTIPAAYRRFATSIELESRIPDYAGRWFPWPERIVPCIGSEQGYIICFLRDQQDVALWYLYLTPQGEELVLVARDLLLDESEEWNYGDGPTAEDSVKILDKVYVCAPSFEAFLYRYWLETTISLKLDGYYDAPLTSEEREYLAHYEAQKDEPELGK